MRKITLLETENENEKYTYLCECVYDRLYACM